MPQGKEFIVTLLIDFLRSHDLRIRKLSVSFQRKSPHYQPHVCTEISIFIMAWKNHTGYRFAFCVSRTVEAWGMYGPLRSDILKIWTLGLRAIATHSVVYYLSYGIIP